LSGWGHPKRHDEGREDEKKLVLEIVSTESSCFFTHPILTHPRVPTRPAPSITAIVSFFHSFLKEREIDWRD
jgi:hypothetical protein